MRKRLVLLSIILSVGVMLLCACAKEPESEDNPSVNVSEEDYFPTEDTNTKTVFPPMVMVNGKLYSDTGYVSSMGRCGVMDGMITSSVDKTKKPTEDNQSNFGAGYEYQFVGNRIDVYMNNRFAIFWEVDAELAGIPEDVAHFEAEVLEVGEGRIKIRLTELPREFRQIFQTETPKELKPIDVSQENPVLPKDMTEDQLLGKTVKIWFDGKAENLEPESSVPISLGQVYLIELVGENK